MPEELDHLLRRIRRALVWGSPDEAAPGEQSTPTGLGRDNRLEDYGIVLYRLDKYSQHLSVVEVLLPDGVESADKKKFLRGRRLPTSRGDVGLVALDGEPRAMAEVSRSLLTVDATTDCWMKHEFVFHLPLRSSGEQARGHGHTAFLLTLGGELPREFLAAGDPAEVPVGEIEDRLLEAWQTIKTAFASWAKIPPENEPAGQPGAESWLERALQGDTEPIAGLVEKLQRELPSAGLASITIEERDGDSGRSHPIAIIADPQVLLRQIMREKRDGALQHFPQAIEDAQYLQHLREIARERTPWLPMENSPPFPTTLGIAEGENGERRVVETLIPLTLPAADNTNLEKAPEWAVRIRSYVLAFGQVRDRGGVVHADAGKAVALQEKLSELLRAVEESFKPTHRPALDGSEHRRPKRKEYLHLAEDVAVFILDVLTSRLARTSRIDPATDDRAFWIRRALKVNPPLGDDPPSEPRVDERLVPAIIEAFDTFLDSSLSDYVAVWSIGAHFALCRDDSGRPATVQLIDVPEKDRDDIKLCFKSGRVLNRFRQLARRVDPGSPKKHRLQGVYEPDLRCVRMDGQLYPLQLPRDITRSFKVVIEYASRTATMSLECRSWAAHIVFDRGVSAIPVALKAVSGAAVSSILGLSYGDRNSVVTTRSVEGWSKMEDRAVCIDLGEVFTPGGAYRETFSEKWRQTPLYLPGPLASHLPNYAYYRNQVFGEIEGDEKLHTELFAFAAPLLRPVGYATYDKDAPLLISRQTRATGLVSHAAAALLTVRKVGERKVLITAMTPRTPLSSFGSMGRERRRYSPDGLIGPGGEQGGQAGAFLQILKHSPGGRPGNHDGREWKWQAELRDPLLKFLEEKVPQLPGDRPPMLPDGPIPNVPDLESTWEGAHDALAGLRHVLQRVVRDDGFDAVFKSCTTEERSLTAVQRNSGRKMWAWSQWFLAAGLPAHDPRMSDLLPRALLLAGPRRKKRKTGIAEDDAGS